MRANLLTTQHASDHDEETAATEMTRLEYAAPTTAAVAVASGTERRYAQLLDDPSPQADPEIAIMRVHVEQAASDGPSTGSGYGTIRTPLASDTASDQQPPALAPPSDEIEYRQYPQRWLVLLVFSLLTITNAIIWICFAPISALAAKYYSVSSSWINLLSMSFMGLYLPGYFLAFWVMDRYGLRTGMCIAAVLQTLGAWMRYCSVITEERHNRAVEVTGFVICVIGQCLAGLAQPMFTNAPAKMSSDWFSVKQRNLATTIGAMSNPIGIAIGQVIPTVLVDHHGGIPLLLFIVAWISTGTCLLCFLLVRRAPPTPPSRTTAERAAEKAARLASPTQANQSFWRGPLVGELRVLLTDRNFLVLMFGVGMGLGLFNAVTTLIEQLVSPAGYNKDDAGIFAALLIVFGLIGAGIVGPVMDKTHAYNKILKGGLIAVLFGTIVLVLSLRPNVYALVAVAFSFLGFVMLPLLPVCMECAAECTYPVSEDASSGLLLFMGNAVGIIMIVVVGELIEKPYRTVFNPAGMTLLAFLTLAVIVVGWKYNGPLKRQAAEQARTIDIEATPEPISSTGGLASPFVRPLASPLTIASSSYAAPSSPTATSRMLQHPGIAASDATQ